MRYQNFYQFALIFFAFVVMFGVATFLYYELFPQYKIYQFAYKDLERFRSTYTHTKPPPFSTGIKQILIPDEEQGPEIIDRCTSCHVAMDLSHFSPTRIARDVNDNPIIDGKGDPVLELNPDYVWEKLDERIAELRHPALIEQLKELGRTSEMDERLIQAQELENLKRVKVEGKKVDMTKVLAMHPLIGSETRPFEYHPVQEYGCTSCHSGNGRALVADRAHGPVFDNEYETAYTLPKPQFTEIDLENDPQFSRMFNEKPGHKLIFQTTPILTGPLIAAKCVQCHLSGSADVQSAIEKMDLFTDRKKEQLERIHLGIENDRSALISLLNLEQSLYKRGLAGTVDWLNKELGDYRLSKTEIDALEGQLAYIQQKGEEGEVEGAIRQDVIRLVSSEMKGEALLGEALKTENIEELVDRVFKSPKEQMLQKGEANVKRLERSQEPLRVAVQDKKLIAGMRTQVDRLIGGYKRGKELYISQACYACHRIAGFSRSSIGPDLTLAGLSYPWFIKESIVWPQADLPSSTMPNFRLDHEELADIMTFMMAQQGNTKAISEVDYQISLKQWEKGEKMPWEKPVSPTAIKDTRQGMLVFASEGCAACHKLEGFESNVGFAIDKNPDATPLEKVEAREWFYPLFPERMAGSKIAEVVEKEATAIDKQIVDGVRSDGILEEIEKYFPGLVQGFYSNFKFAGRAKNTQYREDPEKLAAYKERLRRVLMVYIELYGLGRDIAPHLNWSGIYRDQAWLTGHFRDPSAYTAKSIMPAMPFDDTKFYMLDHMLYELGRKNRDKLHAMWKVQGFNPPLAYELLCSACHGEHRQGNGIISEWIYPIPKNLRNPVFLRQLTKERAIDSITHGVVGTPMPPWGESVDMNPVLHRAEIVQLVDWLYQGLPEERRLETEEEYEKWQYTPNDVVEEMEKEGALLSPLPPKGGDVEELVHTYFEVKPNPIPSPDKELYYIREKYYTTKNIEEAEKFFGINCAPCHGEEGTGTGLRATSMVEAKPRMFLNLPWIRTRDDLRLLRSIKFGVAGTAMIPWGDQTTATQRMQLVMYIRQLTRSALLRDDLEDVLYEAFDQTVLTIEEARIQEYSQLEKSRDKWEAKREELYDLTEAGEKSPEEIAKVYAEEITLEREVTGKEKRDKSYQELIDLLRQERVIYNTIGAQMIELNVTEDIVQNYFELIRHIPFIFTFEENKLTLTISEENSKMADFYLEAILANLDRAIEEYEKKIELQEGKIRSPERGKVIQELMKEQGAYINLRTKLVVQLANAASLRDEEQALFRREENSLR